MKLAQLLQRWRGGEALPAGVAGVEVRRLVDDSRMAKAGDVLVWDARIKPEATAQIVRGARAKGVAAILTNIDVANGGTGPRVGGDDIVNVAEPGRILAAWAAEMWPLQPQVMLGVTGTSGKTSVAWFGAQLAEAAGIVAASVGTLGTVRQGKVVDYSGYTSPTALQMHPMLQGLARDGVKLGVMEVSSHALALHRADGIKFAAGALTNVTQDHFDFHGGYDGYFAAKARLFTEVLPEGSTAVLNVARPESWPLASVSKQRGLKVLTVGTGNAELVVEVVEETPAGLELWLKFDAVPVPVRVPLVGSFQAENLAVSLGLMVAGGARLGLGWGQIAGAMEQLTNVPGRMEVITGQEGQPAVIVDYAHKPDALKRALEAVRPLAKKNGGKLWVVFGCGGNRDATKRPIMGGIAAELADVAVVTDDNPRFEDAAEIRAQVIAGAKGGEVRNIGDRRLAIEEALNGAGPNDVVLVAGKGHEDGQIVGEETLPFDDRVVVRELLG